MVIIIKPNVIAKKRFGFLDFLDICLIISDPIIIPPITGMVSVFFLNREVKKDYATNCI